VRVFSTTLQSTKFDPEGKYIRTWVKELANVPNDYIHDPWNMPKALEKSSGVVVVGEVGGEGIYPRPLACEKYTSADAARKVKRSKSVPKVKSGLGSMLAFSKKV
jgi:deoxyribodipyrimidine photolyase